MTLDTFWIAFHRGGSRIFSWGGGGGGVAKDYLSAGTLRARKSKSLSAGVQDPLEDLGFINALLCYLSLILISILIQIGIKKPSWSNFRGGGGIATVSRAITVMHVTQCNIIFIFNCGLNGHVTWNLKSLYRHTMTQVPVYLTIKTVWVKNTYIWYVLISFSFYQLLETAFQ